MNDGNPIPEFQPIQGDQVHFLDITSDGLKPGVNPNQEAYALWARIEKIFETPETDAIKSTREELWTKRNEFEIFLVIFNL